MKDAYEAFIAAPTDDNITALRDAMRTFQDDSKSTSGAIYWPPQVERKGPPPMVVIEHGRVWVELPAFGQYVSGDPKTGRFVWRVQNDDGTMGNEGGICEPEDLNVDFWDAACDALAAERAGR